VYVTLPKDMLFLMLDTPRDNDGTEKTDNPVMIDMVAASRS